MKNEYVRFLVIAALLVLLFTAAAVLGIGDSGMLLALPFTLLGKGLRALSLSGSVGNLIAILLYTAASLSPLLLLIRRKRTKKDFLLPLCSAVLFYVLYCMVNPGFRPAALRTQVGDLAMAGAVYSVLLCWLIWNLMDTFREAGSDHIYDALRIFLLLCIAEFTLGTVAGLGEVLATIGQVRATNTAPGLNLVPTYIFLLIAFAVTVLEYGLDIWLLCLAGRMLKELRAEAYSEGSYHASRKLSVWCGRSLVILSLITAILNIAQLLFASVLHYVDIGFHLPTVSIGLAFVLLAITRLLHQGKVLKEDNDLFI